MVRVAGLVLAMLAVGGCAIRRDVGPAPGGPVAIERETIRYETAPCFGTCPVYAVTVQPDGHGTFEGQRFTAVIGVREFRITPDQYRRFAAALQPYRPAQGERLIQPGQPGCGNAPTDMPSVDVRWSELSGASQHLNLYYGCGEAGAMREALRAAPDLLPIGDLVGARSASR